MLAGAFSLYKNSFKGLSRETWLLSLVMLINRSGTMVVPFMTLYLTGKDVGRSLSDAGMVMGFFGLGAVIGAYFGGKFTDRIGFYTVQLGTLFFGGILFIVLGQIKSFPLICLFTFLLSLVNEAFRPANSAAIAHYSKVENRTRSYSLNRLAINLGWTFGTSIGGLIAAYNYELLFWVDGVTNICASFLLVVFFKPYRIKKDTGSHAENTPKPESAYKDKTYLWFIFFTVLFAMSFFQLFTTIPKYFRDNLFLSERYIGLIMGLNGLLIVAVEMVLVYKLEGKKSNLAYISMGLVLCALSFFSLLIPGSTLLVPIVMILLISSGEIMSMPFMSSYWVQRSNDSNRGQYAALYTIAWGIGHTLGPYACSVLVDTSGFKVLFILLGALLLTAAVGFYNLRGSGKKLVPEGDLLFGKN